MKKWWSIAGFLLLNVAIASGYVILGSGGSYYSPTPFGDGLFDFYSEYAQWVNLFLYMLIFFSIVQGVFKEKEHKGLVFGLGIALSMSLVFWEAQTGNNLLMSFGWVAIAILLGLLFLNVFKGVRTHMIKKPGFGWGFFCFIVTLLLFYIALSATSRQTGLDIPLFVAANMFEADANDTAILGIPVWSFIGIVVLAVIIILAARTKRNHEPQGATPTQVPSGHPAQQAPGAAAGAPSGQLATSTQRQDVGRHFASALNAPINNLQLAQHQLANLRRFISPRQDFQDAQTFRNFSVQLHRILFDVQNNSRSLWSAIQSQYSEILQTMQAIRSNPQFENLLKKYLLDRLSWKGMIKRFDEMNRALTFISPQELYRRYSHTFLTYATAVENAFSNNLDVNRPIKDFYNLLEEISSRTEKIIGRMNKLLSTMHNIRRDIGARYT